jgi:hypothetical protein
MGNSRRLVWRDELHQIDRFPSGQACASSARLVPCRTASGGTRGGTSGQHIGHAHRTWAVAEAAALVWRHKPPGPKLLRRVENKPDTGKAHPRGLRHRRRLLAPGARGRPLPRTGHELARPTRSASLLTRTVGGPGIMARSQRRTATRLCHHRVSDDGTSRSVWCSQACLAPGHGHHLRTPDRRLKTLALPRRKKRNKSALRSRLSLDKRRPHKGSASLVVTFRDVLCS